MIVKTSLLGRAAWFVSLLVLFLASPVRAQSAHPEDATFAAARDAFVKGDRARFARASAGLQSHPLTPWVTYFRLVLQLQDGSDAGVNEFIASEEGNYLAEKMRADWLRWLVRQEDWSAALMQFSLLQKPDAEAHCLGLETRLRLNQLAVSDVLNVLGSEAPLNDACLTPLRRLAQNGELPAEAVWPRLRRQWALGRMKEARTLHGWLPKAETPSWRAIETVVEHPARHIAKLPARFERHRSERELAMLAAIRMASADSRVAAVRWADIENHFEPAERGFVWGRLARTAALAHLPEARHWFEQAASLGASFDEDQHAWRVRAALRAGDWVGVARAIDAMPGNLAAQPDWEYWRARAHAAAGQADLARQRYERIAGQANFYGVLATEALARPYALPPRAAPLSNSELASIAATPGIQRGLALIRNEVRLEGLREWNWALAAMNDRQLLAAAEFARREGVIDRSISAADRTRAEHDFALRYPMPFRDQVVPRVHEVGLDPAWVYGLMRQESRFIMDAKSSAGAKGLMQLMPATAKWVAKKIGMDNYHPAKVTQMDINVTLGTNYMRMVMESLDNHPVLASAAYNAGPGRARKWRGETPLEGAIYAETIPFTETRDYVKKVMANAIHYAALAGGPGHAAPSLTTKLGTIRPRGFGDTTAEDLP